MQAVAIVIRTKDRPIFLKRALDSVLSQTYGGWHCTVINDGGEASSVDAVIAQLPENNRRRISVIHNAMSMGMEAASNIGLKSCRADYYVIHDDDDTWAPDFLETCIGALRDNRVQSVQGAVAHTVKIQEVIEGERIIERKRSVFLPEVTAFTIPRVVQNNPFMPIAFVYTHAALECLGGYDESLAAVGDWEFNLRFIRSFDILYVPNTTAFYHVRMKVREDSTDNSIAKQNLHRYYRTLIMNRYIREAMDKGDLSLGHLMAASEPGLHINRLGEKLTYLYPRLGGLRLVSLIKRMLGRS